MPVDVKICGITTEEALEAAVEYGATHVGLVFFPPSPRFIAPDAAAELTEFLPEDMTKVGLFVDPDDAWLNEVLSHCRVDMIQLHGKESPERVEEIRLDFGLPVMKAISVAGPEDLASAESYKDSADWLLLDAKAPKGAVLPGGNAVSFDWTLLKGWKSPLPWMLAGGLTVDNLAEAVQVSGAKVIDVSSGVEDAPGIKNPARIKAFLDRASEL